MNRAEQTRKLLLLVGAVCVYVAQELIPGPAPARAITTRPRRT